MPRSKSLILRLDRDDRQDLTLRYWVERRGFEAIRQRDVQHIEYKVRYRVQTELGLGRSRGVFNFKEPDGPEYFGQWQVQILEPNRALQEVRNRVLECEERDESLFQDIDGYWKWWPKGGNGYRDAVHLRILADELDRRNRPWDDVLDNDPALNNQPKEQDG